ncbi:MAG: hypothetical protein IKL11_05505 [Muribaculaceae bacterium]|nr:hypothetical protein [Muribaculaceae bacterium]
MNTLENSKESKWTEIELLPEWDEEFYDVYTAKKFGKWLNSKLSNLNIVASKNMKR